MTSKILTGNPADPFKIDGPAVVSFSGGRTSGMMLRRILDAHAGELPADVHVIFANTGKERGETLDFVEACGTRWGVDVHWVERGRGEVTPATASRNGEPFGALIEERAFLPNPVTRYCTVELKIMAMRDWMRGAGYSDDEWTNVVGLRADEPHRVARMRNHGKAWDVAAPLAAAGITVEDVAAFWQAQDFDLQLSPWEGNCDLCFLKGREKRARIMRDHPDLAAWWIEQEAVPRAGARLATFRNDTPSYARLLESVQQQPTLFQIGACSLDDLGDCVCTD